MKQGEIQSYKGIGTIQMVLNEDGHKCYAYNHFFSGRGYEEDTIKGAKEMLDYEERQVQEIKQAISILSRHNYKIFKEIA
jgi:hypothetical protein